MIQNTSPLSMAEATAYMDKEKETTKEIKGFVKKFGTLKAKDAQAMRKKIHALDIIKIDESHISKIIDLMPENAEELNKIFVGMGLDEDETKNILDIVKEFR